MNMTTTDFKDLMLYGERINIEYKEATDDLPKSLWGTYSAFASTIGGGIVYGIKEHRNRYDAERLEIKGIADGVPKMLRTFGDTINSDKVSCNKFSSITWDVSSMKERHSSPYMCQWPTTPCAQYLSTKPCRSAASNGTMEDHHCTDEEVISMLRDANENWNNGLLLDNYDVNDIDLPILHAFCNYFKTRNVDLFFNLLDDKDFLRNQCGMTSDRLR